MAIWKKYQALKGFNDKTRQDSEAENLLSELSITMPENCTATQFTLLASRYQLKVNDHLLRQMNPKLQVRWLLDRMPKSTELISAKARILSRSCETQTRKATVGASARTHLARDR